MAKPAAPSAWRQAVTSNPAATSTSPTALLVGIVFVVGALYLGSEILIPLALAILLSFMLAPIVTGCGAGIWGAFRRSCWLSCWCSQRCLESARSLRPR